MQGYWQDGKYILASTQQDRIAAIEAANLELAVELKAVKREAQRHRLKFQMTHNFLDRCRVERAILKRAYHNRGSVMVGLARRLSGADEIYCPVCGSCGESGCCPPDRCKTVQGLYCGRNVETWEDMLDENDLLRDKLSDIEGYHAAVMRDNPDQVHCSCVPGLREALESIVKSDPKSHEVCCDEFAYDRMVDFYRKAVESALKEADT